MAVTRSDKVYSGTLSGSEDTVATIAASTTFIMKGFVISNANAVSKYFTFKVNDIRIAVQRSVPSKDSIIITDLNIPVLTTQTIKVTGEVATDMDYYIWGIEEVTS